jgi:hypothetical protein
MDGVVAQFLIQLVEHSVALPILGFSSFRFILSASHFRPGRRIEIVSTLSILPPEMGENPFYPLIKIHSRCFAGTS